MELSELYSSASSESVNSVVLAGHPGSTTAALPAAVQAVQVGSGGERRHLQNGIQLPAHVVVDDDDGGSSSDDDDVEMRRECEMLNTTSSSSSSEENVIV